MRTRLAALMLVSLGCGPESVSASGDGTSSDGATTGGSSTGASTTTTASTTSSSSSSESTESTAVDSSTGPLTTCGDGTLDANEECDDGNVDDGDTCSSTCTSPFTIAWDRTVNGPDDLEDFAHDVAIADDGTIYVVGKIRTLANSDELWVGQYAPDGTEGWTFVFDGVDSQHDQAQGVALHPSGDLIVVGSTESFATGMDMLVLRIATADQSIVWQRTYDGTDDQAKADVGDFASGVAVDPGGDIVVGGTERALDEGYNMWLRRYDADGGELWTVTYQGTPNSDRLEAVAIDGDGVTWIAGTEYLDPGYQSWVRAFDATGALQTEQVFAGDFLNDVATAEDGDVVVGGWTPQGALTDALAMRLHADLSSSWTNVHNGVDLRSDALYGVAVGANGEVYVGGYETVEHLGTDSDLWIARLAGDDGTPVWSDRHNGRNDMNDRADAIAVAPDGSIVMAGYISAMGEDLNIWVRKYVEP